MQLCAVYYIVMLVFLLFATLIGIAELSILRLLATETFGALSILLLIYAVISEDPLITVAFIAVQVLP